MKQVIKRIIAFSLSICIVVLSILLCPISVYASGGVAGWLGDAWESFDHWATEKGLKIVNCIPFVLSQ
ncbi:MAG: hypothetical protein HDT21_01390, partial [Ruminococcus sp.]|nr:hypothetical protein [Ruminococcus sp.]